MIAYLIGGNIIAALIGTWVGNPITYPLIWLGTFHAGAVLIGAPRDVGPPNLGVAPANGWWDSIVPVILPMAVGSVPIGLTVAALAYGAVRVVVGRYQAARR